MFLEMTIELTLEELNVIWPIWKPVPLTLAGPSRFRILRLAFFQKSGLGHERYFSYKLSEWDQFQHHPLGQTPRGSSHLAAISNNRLSKQVRQHFYLIKQNKQKNWWNFLHGFDTLLFFFWNQIFQALHGSPSQAIEVHRISFLTSN